MKVDLILCIVIKCWDIYQSHNQSEADPTLLSKVSQASVTEESAP